MALPATIEKTRKDIEKAIADSGALQAVAGAGDLAVKKLRDARTEVASRAATLDTKALREQAQATVAGAPEQVKALPEKAQAAFGDVVTSALTAYGDLAERGQALVARVRGQKATQDLKAQAAATTSHAKATATTAKKSAVETKDTATSAAKSASSSAKTTGATAKKGASRTKTAAKSTATSAKKTASAAKKATDDAASKVGD